MTGPALGDRGDPDELALVAAGFPAFHIWRQTFCDRIRYTAQARDLTTHPNTVITGDLAELHAALLDHSQTSSCPAGASVPAPVGTAK